MQEAEEDARNADRRHAQDHGPSRPAFDRVRAEDGAGDEHRQLEDAEHEAVLRRAEALRFGLERVERGLDGGAHGVEHVGHVEGAQDEVLTPRQTHLSYASV